MECCGKAAAFVLRRRLAIEGRHRSVRWCVNRLFSKTLRDVALRAIGVTVYGVLRQSRSFRAATTLGDKGASPKCAVVREHVVQHDAA